MILSKEEMAKQIAMVRCTGRTNMADRYSVAKILLDMSYLETAMYISQRNHLVEFVELLTMSGEVEEAELKEYDYETYTQFVLLD